MPTRCSTPTKFTPKTGARVSLLLKIAFLTLFTCSGSAMAVADESIAVVAAHNSPLPALSKEEVSTLFMGLTHAAHGINGITPFDQPEGTSRELFYLKLVDKTPNRMRAYWSRRVFTGKALPPAELTPQALSAQLQADLHAISYLPTTQVDATLKILTILP